MPAMTASSRRDQRGGEERDPEEEVETEGGTHDLGEVGGHRDRLGLKPEPDRGPAVEALPAEFRQILAGRDPELCGLGLDQHRDQVRREHDPEQQISELRAAGDVRGEVAGIDVCDRRDEGRAEERPNPRDPPRLASKRALRGVGDGRFAGKHVLDVCAGGVPVARRPGKQVIDGCFRARARIEGLHEISV
jgi:hypothetical protein